MLLFSVLLPLSGITEDWNKAFQEAELAFQGRNQTACIPLFENLIRQIGEEAKSRLLTADEKQLLVRSLDYLGQTHFNLNQQEKSRAAFLKLLELDPDYTMSEDLVSSKIIALFQELKAKNMGTLAVRAPAGAAIRLDGRLLDPASLGKIRVVQGSHEVEAGKSGLKTVKKTVSVSAGETVDVQLDLEVDPAKAQMAESANKQLRMLQVAAARDSFERLLQEGSAEPEIRSAYSETLLLLGFDKKARQEAQLAHKQAGESDPQQKLAIEGRALETAGNCQKAAEAYGKLSLEAMDSVVWLARVQLQCGLAKTSLETVRSAQFRGLKDPRLSLSEAEALAAMRDYAAQRDAASAAIQNAANAEFVISRARNLQAIAELHLGESETARATFLNLLQSPATDGDPLLRALPHMGLAKIYLLQDKAVEAEKEYQSCRQILEKIGNERYLPEALLGLGNTALAQQDAGAARAHFSAALQLTPTNPVRASLELGLGQALVVLQDPSAAKSHFENALELARKADDKTSIATVLSNLAPMQAGDAAESMYREAILMFQELGNKASETEAQIGLAGILETRGELAAAGELYTKALPRIRESGNKKATAELLHRIGRLLLRTERKTDAGSYFRESVAIYQELGDQASADNVREDLNLLNVDYRNRVVLLLQQGFKALNARNYRSAADSYEEALKLAEDIGDLSSQANALNSLGFVYSQQGDDSTARERWKLALEISRKAADKRAEALALFNLASAEFNLGNRDRANSLFDESVAISKSIGEKPRSRPW